MSTRPIQKIQFTQSMHQIDFIKREEERVLRNNRLAALRNQSASCFSCTAFHNPSILVSQCSKKNGKDVKFYNLCERYEAKK